MQEFPANSKKARVPDEPKKIERVTSAEAVRRKKGLGQKFRETFIGGDARTATDYVIFHVLIPSAKDMLAEAASSGIERLIYGETRPRRGHTSGYSGLGHVNYNRMSTSQNKQESPRTLSRAARARHDFDDIVIPSRQDAEEVIDRLFDLLDRYGSASVAELYELTGIQSSHVDHKWGWRDLRGSKAARLRSGGFLLDLPDPEPLN